MKIGYDAKRLFHNNTGLGNYSRDLIKILVDYLPQIDIVLYNPKPKNHPNFLVKKSNYQEINPKGIWKKMSGVWRSILIPKDSTFKTLDIYHGLSGEIPKGIPLGVKKVVTIHDLIFLRYPHLYNFVDVKIHTSKFKYACAKADKIVAISQQTKEDIIHYFGVSENKIEVIYQGCSSVFKELYDDNAKKVVASKFNLPKKFLLNVGTIEERKNALNIVKAIKGTEITLVLVGKKTKYYQLIEDYLQEHKMLDQVIVLKGLTQQELAILYQLATIFIYPSIFEGFGIPIIEALFSGTPVITNKDGVFPEAGGSNSLYVVVQDVSDIQNKILSLWNDREKLEQMTKDGFSFVQKFNDDKIAKQWNDFYLSLM